MITQRLIDRAHSAEGGMARHYLMLYACVLGVEAKRVFEFGAGYSSQVILDALEETGGELISCDPQSDEVLGMKPHKRWTHIQKNSRKALKKIDGVFDLVFHDGSHKHEEVRRDLRKILPRVKKSGLILVHDTFDSEKKYYLQKALEMFIGEKVTLCYGHGLTIIRQTEGEIAINPKWTKDRNEVVCKNMG